MDNQQLWTVLGFVFVTTVVLSVRRIALALIERGKAGRAAMPERIETRLTRLEQAIETMAVEMERIGEGQRFLTGILTKTGTGSRELTAESTDSERQSA